MEYGQIRYKYQIEGIWNIMLIFPLSECYCTDRSVQ